MVTKFLNSPFIISWVPVFLIFSFNRGTLEQEGGKGNTQEPRECIWWRGRSPRAAKLHLAVRNRLGVHDDLLVGQTILTGTRGFGCVEFWGVGYGA